MPRIEKEVEKQLCYCVVELGLMDKNVTSDDTFSKVQNGTNETFR